MIPDVFGVVIAAVEMSPMLACGSDIGEHGISMRLGTEADVGPGICYQMGVISNEPFCYIKLGGNECWADRLGEHGEQFPGQQPQHHVDNTTADER